MNLDDLLMGGPGHDGYAYCADVYCVECGQDIIRELYEKNGAPKDDLVFRDSEEWPQPIFFGESPDCAQYCADCEEYLYGEDEDSPDDPGDDDYITYDHQQFYQSGKVVVVVPDGEDWEPYVNAHMEENQYWPNVWFVSDHGNYHLLTLTEGRES